MINTYPMLKDSAPMWELNLILRSLMEKPFEPVATCLLLHLSMKVAFLIAITSGRRVGELRTLMIHPPFTTFYKDKVILWLHPKFVPKVASSFHLNQTIYLPVFFPKPHADNREAFLHMLDVRRVLAFYQERTKTFRKLSLFSL